RLRPPIQVQRFLLWQWGGKGSARRVRRKVGTIFLGKPLCGNRNPPCMSTLPPILLVDDDSDDLFILRRLIGKAGIKNKTVAFEDPKAAVAHLIAEIANHDELYLPCLIFTDLNMPRMDGIELTRWIRDQPALADTTVIMVSSSEDPRDKANAMDAGARQFLLKYPTASVLASIAAE